MSMFPEGTIFEALGQAVLGAGGGKVVGTKLWPAKTPEAARQHLARCINPECAEKLSLEELVLILRLARERGCHVGMNFFATTLGYAEPVPIDPKDELAELVREQNELLRQSAKRQERIERLLLSNRPTAV